MQSGPGSLVRPDNDKPWQAGPATAATAACILAASLPPAAVCAWQASRQRPIGLQVAPKDAHPEPRGRAAKPCAAAASSRRQAGWLHAEWVAVPPPFGGRRRGAPRAAAPCCLCALRRPNPAARNCDRLHRNADAVRNASRCCHPALTSAAACCEMRCTVHCRALPPSGRIMQHCTTCRERRRPCRSRLAVPST